MTNGMTTDLVLDGWAARITAALQQTLEAIFETGRLLTDAKESLAHGQWLRLFDERRVPMSSRTAERYMAIHQARGRLLPNSTHVSYLPASWGTLAELAALPPAVLENARAQGLINPELERQDVIGWRREGVRSARLEALARQGDPAAPTRRYSVFLADPPWHYEHSVSGSRDIENHYETLTSDAIAALPVADWATDDAVLFCWATSPKLTEALEVIEHWAFTYRTCLVWVKDVIGMGYWVRQRHELLLVATRGEMPAPPPSARPDSVIEAPRGSLHSEKPSAVHEAIERMFPALSKIELFARRRRPGWDAWGDEVPNADS